MSSFKLNAKQVEKKSDKNKVQFTNSLLFSRYKDQDLSLSAKVIGQWTIEKEERCNICWVNIKPDEPFTRCTSCNNKFHSDHWREWIIKKQSCPICNVKITF